MKVERINRGTWGKLRAYFDLRTSDGFVIKGFKIVEGINGLFVSMPSQKGTNQEGGEEWYDTVWADKDVKDELEKIAIREYGQDSPASSQSFNNDESMQTSESKTQDVKNEEFNDDDIPF